MSAIRTKTIVLALVLLVVGTALAFASSPLAYTYTWRWVINDPEVTSFRYQLDTMDGEWTVVDASVTSFSIDSDVGQRRFYLEQSYDGVIWSDVAWKDLGVPGPVELLPAAIVPVTEPVAVGQLNLRRFIVKLSLGAQYAVKDGSIYNTYDANGIYFDRLQPLATFGLVVDNLIRFGNTPWGLGLDVSAVYAPYLYAAGSSNPTGSVSTGGSDWSKIEWARFAHVVGFTVAPKVNVALSKTMHLSVFGGIWTSFPTKDDVEAGWNYNPDVFGWTAGLGWRWDISKKISLSLDASWNALPEYRHNAAGRLGVGYMF
ncbi:hypothetical protein [Parasphaerochaeta coccoides]|uniref:Outer membrane protein beta-barrel domain-containing protein n=1 Tax=Parasphaerochaeta coccoides (strain ATCC BAA-1237 / DSM 17374 / SPN1) TaxID=760011 RepID=F4GLR6_PARC1|nr:hypothetical protein [Parasphaerochaeta coccoides]AEC02460.1 hypothetical protein Spico_1250 [Parasphaerochaeta coccoides DSM 17374]